MVVSLGATSACIIKDVPLPAEEADAVALAVTRAVRGDMDIMTITKVSLPYMTPYLRIALKVFPDKIPQSKDALRAHIHSNAMEVIRQVALHSSMTEIVSIRVEYYVNVFTAPRQQRQGSEHVRLLYSTGVGTKALKEHDVSKITNAEMAAFMTHNIDEIRKLDLPN